MSIVLGLRVPTSDNDEFSTSPDSGGAARSSRRSNVGEPVSFFASSLVDRLYSPVEAATARATSPGSRSGEERRNEESGRVPLARRNGSKKKKKRKRERINGQWDKER